MVEQSTIRRSVKIDAERANNALQQKDVEERANALLHDIEKWLQPTLAKRKEAGITIVQLLTIIVTNRRKYPRMARELAAIIKKHNKKYKNTKRDKLTACLGSDNTLQCENR